jgi:hypothetical protein
MVYGKYASKNPIPDDITATVDWLSSKCPQPNTLFPGCYSTYYQRNGNGDGTNNKELAALASQYFGLTTSARFSNQTFTGGLAMLQNELSHGYPVIVYVMTHMKGKKGLPHYMVLLGMDDTNVYVNDPEPANGRGISYPLAAFKQSWGPINLLDPITLKEVPVQDHSYSGVTIHPNEPPTPQGVLVATDMPVNTPYRSFGLLAHPFATEFILTTAVTVTNISLDMNGYGAGQFTLWLTDAIGASATQSDILLQLSLPFPDNISQPNSVFGTPVTANANIALTPGTYYLILSSTETGVSAQGWALSTTPLSGSVGIAPNIPLCATGSNDSFPPASTFQTCKPATDPFRPDFWGGNGPAFQILGIAGLP